MLTIAMIGSTKISFKKNKPSDEKKNLGLVVIVAIDVTDMRTQSCNSQASEFESSEYQRACKYSKYANTIHNVREPCALEDTQNYIALILQ